jgi:hypothetical protein
MSGAPGQVPSHEHQQAATGNGDRSCLAAASDAKCFPLQRKYVEHPQLLGAPLTLLLLLLLLLQLDMVIWAVASGFLHGCSVARMLLDELPVR